MRIGRVWHGWTTHANADAFETYIRNEEWPAIFARNIKGLREIECLRLVRPGHTEFKTVMRFDSMESVEQFAGPDVTKAVLTPRAIELLRRYDARAEHFEIRAIRSSRGGEATPTEPAAATRDAKPAEPSVQACVSAKRRQARMRQSA
jgi:hypothetical protein